MTMLTHSTAEPVAVDNLFVIVSAADRSTISMLEPRLMVTVKPMTMTMTKDDDQRSGQVSMLPRGSSVTVTRPASE